MVLILSKKDEFIIRHKYFSSMDEFHVIIIYKDKFYEGYIRYNKKMSEDDLDD